MLEEVMGLRPFSDRQEIGGIRHRSHQSEASECGLMLLAGTASHLDVMKERLVNDAVTHLRLTKVIVAHRPETIGSADRVLVMDAGRIVQEILARQSAADTCGRDAGQA